MDIKTLQPYFVQNLDSLFSNMQDNYDYNKVKEIHSMMNISRVYDYQTELYESANNYIGFYIEKTNNARTIQGYDYLVSDYSVDDYEMKDTSCSSFLLGKNWLSVCYDPKRNRLLFLMEKDSSISFDLSFLLTFSSKKIW